jgi:hypothetical protein
VNTFLWASSFFVSFKVGGILYYNFSRVDGASDCCLRRFLNFNRSEDELRRMNINVCGEFPPSIVAPNDTKFPARIL